MKRILFLMALICLEKTLHAQAPRTPYIYSIKADSVKITNTCDTAELIIENHTQTVPGFLFNKGRGRTEFRRINQFNDTSVVIGGDTVHLGRGYKNFANADLTFDGNHVHHGAFHSVNLTDFSNIGFRSNSTDNTQSTEITMNPSQGYSVSVNNISDPNSVLNSSEYRSDHEVYGFVGETTPETIQGSQFGYYTNGANFYTTTMDLNTGTWTSAGVKIERTDYYPQEITMYSEDGNMRIYSLSDVRDTRTEINFNRGDSLVTTCGRYGYGSSGVVQNIDGFRFGSTDSLRFQLHRLPVSTNSQDSVLVIDGNGQVKKQAQSNLTPALNITQAEIMDVTAQVDAVTKLPHLYSWAGHSVSLPPAANHAGKKIYIWNQNYSTNLWTFSSSITLPDGTTSNAIPNQSTMELLSDGNVWVKWK